MVRSLAGRAVRLLFWTAVAAALLLAIGLGALLAVDPARFRVPLATRLSTALGRPVTFAGDPSWTLSLRPTITLRGVRVAASAEAAAPELLRAERVDVQLALVPLLRGVVRVARLRLDGAAIELAGGGQAPGAWPLPASAEAEAATLTRSTLTLRGGTTGGSLEIGVNEATVRAAPGKPLTLVVDGAVSGLPFTLALTGGSPGELAAGPAHWPLALRLDVADTTLDARGGLVRAPDEGAPVRLELTEIALRIASADLRGRATVGLVDGRPRIEGALTVTAPRPERGGVADRPAAPASSSWRARPIPAPLLRALDAALTLEAPGVEIAGLAAGAVATAALEHGRLDARVRLAPAAGTIAGRITLDARGTPLLLALEGTADGIDLARIPALAFLTRAARGTRASVHARADGRGTTLGEMLARAHVKIALARAAALGGGPAAAGRATLTTATLTAHEGRSLDLELGGTYEGTPVTLRVQGPALADLPAAIGPGPWPAAATLGDVRLAGRLTRTADGFSFGDLTGRRGRTEFTGTLALALGGARPALRGTLAAKTVALEPLAGPRQTAVELLPPAASLRAFDATLAITIGELVGGPAEIRDLGLTATIADGRLALAPLEGRIAGGTVRGTVTFEGAAPGVRPRLGATLALSDARIGGSRAAGSLPQRPATGVGDWEIPVARLRALDARVDLVAERLQWGRGEIGSLSARLVLADGELVVAPLHGTLWEGRVDGRVAIDARSDPPATAVAFESRALRYPQLLAGLGMQEPADGTADVTVDLAGDGSTLRRALDRARGRIAIVAGPGTIAVRDIDLWATDLVRSLLPMPKRDEISKMNCAVARFAVTGGVAESRGILVDTARITVAGAGTVRLQDGRIAIVLSPMPKSAGLVSLATPVELGGTLAHPRVSASKVDLLKRIPVGLVAAALDPPALLARFASLGTDAGNRCAAALEPASRERAPPSGIVDQTRGVLRGLERSVGGILKPK